MDDKIQNYDKIEGLRQAVIMVLQGADEAKASKLKEAMDVLLSGVSQLGSVFQRRCAQVASQKQPRKAKPPKSAPVNGPQKPKRPPSSTDMPRDRKSFEKRSEAQSRIMRGVQRAEPSPADQQRALRNRVYGAQNGDVAFLKAAKAIAR